VTVSQPTYAAVVPGPPDLDIDPRENAGRIVLDSGRWPHVTSDLVVTAAPGLLDDIDPRDNRRLQFTVNNRTFDLGIRDAVPDRRAGTIKLALASDEALLNDYAQLLDDKGPRAHQASLRDVVDYTLDKIGAQLEPGDTDADVTAYWPVTNLLANPSAEVNVANWVMGTGATSLVRVVMAAPGAPSGVAAVGFNTAAGIANIVPAPNTNANNFTIRPGHWYVFSFYICSNVSRTSQAAIQWWSNNGSTLSSQVFGTPVTTTSTEFRRVSIIAQAPAGASHAYPYVHTLGNATGNAHYVDCAMFYEGDELIPYFDGATPDTDTYEYVWANTAHGSTSTRVPTLERPPEALTWPAGRSALAFLHPLVQASGLRLVCNERREWTLREADYREPGAQAFREGVNIHDVDEKISRDDEDWFDGAVFRYRWTDEAGVEQTRIDAYALPGASKIIERELDAVYVGPGRARYAVERAQGRGRVVTATKQADWTEAAEQAFSAHLDGVPVQVGIASRVEFDIAANTVTTTSRTTDTPAGAILLLTGTINGLTGTINDL
jgi:hypothetical protein